MSEIDDIRDKYLWVTRIDDLQALARKEAECAELRETISGAIEQAENEFELTEPGPDNGGFPSKDAIRLTREFVKQAALGKEK